MLNTVNVIEINEGVILSIRSFKDDKQGNIEAEKLFTKIIKENDINKIDNDIEHYLERGYYDNDYDYQCCIAHSS